VTIAQLGIEHLSLFGSTARGGAREESDIDDQDVAFYENYVCGAARNYIDYRNAEVDKLIDKQSAGA
jgi:predicted nucleotidyltransferase